MNDETTGDALSRRGDAGHAALREGWTVWRTVGVRGAGFPVAMLEPLAAPEALEAIDHLLARERELEAARSALADSCGSVLRGKRNLPRAAIRKLLRRIKSGRVPEPIPELPEIESRRLDFARAHELLDDAGAVCETTLEAAQARVSEALRAAARDPRFRLALAWQNRGALRDGVDVLLRAPPGHRNQRVRKHEATVALYLQRYCAKNDTIGFFGPMGWGRFVDTGPALVTKPGPGLVSHREVFFEYRAIDRLSARLGRDASLRPWLKPRLSPLVRIEGTKAKSVFGKSMKTGAQLAALLVACDGETAARDIASRLAADPRGGWTGAGQVLEMLARLADKAVVIWNAEVPIVPRPEQRLHALLEDLADETVRRSALAPLEEIESARARVAAEGCDAETLDRAMADLEERFEHLTGDTPTQFEGQVYGGRTLVYEDCRRDLEIAFGPALLERLAPALTPLLLGARWLTSVMARRFLAILDGIYDRLAAEAGGGDVEFGPLFNRAYTAGDAIYPAFTEIADDFEARWREVTGWDGEAARVSLSPETAMGRVREVFGAPCPGWPGARQHSPDVMIAARDEDAIQRGDFLFVLGELHAGSNNVLQTPMFLMHPNPDEVAELQHGDMGLPRILSVNHRAYQRGQRTAPLSPVASDLRLACNDAPSPVPPARTLRLADLTVERTGRGLYVRNRRDGRRFHVIQLFEHMLRSWSARNFAILSRPDHGPRVTIGDLVARRESWRFPCADLAFAWEKHDTKRAVALHRWRRAQGLPRHVFARLPQENKPVYVDFASPPSCDILAKLIRAAETARETRPGPRSAPRTVTLSEMMPQPGECWLADKDGNRYTSELRIVAVDPVPWRPEPDRPERG
jgi:hypothetical protein